MNLKKTDKVFITDKKVIKLLNKPLIRDILNCLSDKPKTATEIALLVSFPKDKIYYHIKNLISYDILYISNVRKVNGVNQKTFFPTSKKFITVPVNENTINKIQSVSEPSSSTNLIKESENVNNKKIKVITRKLQRRRRIERRILLRRQYITRRNATKNLFKGYERRKIDEQRTQIDQRIQIERREIYDRRIIDLNENKHLEEKLFLKKQKKDTNFSIPYKNYLLKMRGVKQALSFVYDGKFVTVLHCKLSKIGFEIFSSHKYEFPLIEKGFAIHTLPEFIINITDQIISENKIGKLFISIHSEYHQYEMTYLTNDKRNNKKTINKIFESFSLQNEDIISDIKNDKTGQTSIIYTKQKKTVNEDVLKLKEHGVNIRYNTSIPKIIYNLYTYYNLNEEKNITLLCYIGNEKTHIIICKNKTIIGSSDFPKGLNFFLKRLMGISTKSSIGDQIYFDAAHYLSFYGIKMEPAEDVLIDGFSNVKAQSMIAELLDTYKNDLQKSIELIYGTNIYQKEEIISKAYICGPGSHIKNLNTNFTQILKCGVESLAKINDDFLRKAKIRKSDFLFNINKNKIFKKRENSNSSLNSIKNTIQKKKIAIEAIKSPESVKYKLARLEIEKSTKIKSIDQATKKLVHTAKEFKEVKREFTSQHKILNDDFSIVTKDLEDKGARLINNYNLQDQLKEKISEIEYGYDQNSKKNKNLKQGYKNQYQTKIKSATNSRYKFSEEKEELESKIDSIEQQIIKKQDELQYNNIKLDNGQSEYATFEYLKDSIQRTANAFKKSFIDKVRALEDVSDKDLNSLNEASYLIVQNTKRVNEIKESFDASINGVIDQTQFIDEDRGDSTKKNLMKLLSMILEVPDAVIELKTFFSTVIKINEDQKELTERKQTIKNQIKKSNLNQKEIKRSLQLITNEINSIEKDIKQKEDKRAGLKDLLIFVRESIQMLNDIDHQNHLMAELKKQIKLNNNEIKDLEKDIKKIKDEVESKEDENSKINIDMKRAQKRNNHELNSKEKDLKKLEIENNNLSEKIEEQVHFIKHAKIEVTESENSCVQLEKNILNKKSDLEDLNEEKMAVSEKYSKEESIISNQFGKQIIIIKQNKNQKIKESEKTKNSTIKTFFEKEKATLKKKRKSINAYLLQLDKDKDIAEIDKEKTDKALTEKKRKLIPEISKNRESIKLFFRDLKKGRKIEEKLINLENKKSEWDLLLRQEEERHKNRVTILQESINRKKAPSYVAFVKEGISKFNKGGDSERIAKSMAEESINLDLEEIKKEQTSFNLFKARYDIFMKKYRKSHREVSAKIKPFGGRQKAIRQKIKAAELKITKSENTIQQLSEKLENKNALFQKKKDSLDNYIVQGQEDIKKLDIQLIRIPEKRSRAEYDIDTKTAMKVASYDKELEEIERDYKSLLSDLNAQFQNEKIIIETSKIENEILEDLEEIEKTNGSIHELKSNIKDAKQLHQRLERKLKREQKRTLEYRNLISINEVKNRSIEDDLALRYDLNVKKLLKEQSVLINSINKYDDLNEQIKNKTSEIEEVQTKTIYLQEKVQKSLEKNKDELLKYPSKKILNKSNLKNHMEFMLQIEKDLIRNLEQSENFIYKINSSLDRKKEDQTNFQRNINLIINDLSYFKDDQIKIEKTIQTNSKYLKDIKSEYYKTLDLILNVKESYPPAKLLINERISIVQTLIDLKLKASETFESEIDDLKNNLRKFKVDIALIDEELSKVNFQMKVALEKSFYEDENNEEVFDWGIDNDHIESYSSIAKLKSKSKEVFNDIVLLEEEIGVLKHKKTSIRNLIIESEKLSQNKIKKMEEVCTTLELQITKEKHEIVSVEENINDLKGLAFNYGDRIKKMEKELKEFRAQEAEQELILKDLDRSIEIIKTKSDFILKKNKHDFQNTIENDFTANFGLLMDPYMELNLIPKEDRKNEAYYFTNKVMQNILIILLLVFSISSFIKDQKINPIKEELPIKKAELELLNMRTEIKNIVKKDNELVKTYYTIIDEDNKVSSEMIDILKFLSNKTPKAFNVTAVTLDKLQPNYFQENNKQKNDTDIIINIEGFFNKGLESSLLLAKNFINDLKGSDHFKKVELSKPDLQNKYKTAFNMTMVY